MLSSLARFSTKQKQEIIRAYLRLRRAPPEESREDSPSIQRLKATLQRHNVLLGEAYAIEQLLPKS